MSFLSPTFLVALVAAAGPVIIHLLNRRRFRTVEWAAMEFLRHAVRRSRRIVELRDTLLLLLRTLAVALFILAMARPIWSSHKQSAYGGEPVHAVLVVDNSLSMAYKPFDESLLDLAKKKAGEFIKILPKGSRISIIPLCGRDVPHARTTYASEEDALEALSRIEIVDRIGRAGQAAEKAKRACREIGDLPTKRVVLISDMQRLSWSDAEIAKDFEGLADVQVVPIGSAVRNNAWVSEFRLVDGVADIETPAVFAATVRFQGEAPRTGIRVSLVVDDVIAEERVVDLSPGQHLSLVFQHRFDASGTVAEPLFVPARLEISGDELAEDNQRSMLVPVVGKMPVVFVDQYGSRELPRINRYGETYPLRRLFTAKTAGGRTGRALVDVRHLTVDQLAADSLRDVRLAVIAGVRAPSGDAVDVLRAYVEQGGQLFLAAGAEFDPPAWTQAAWLDGKGILPAPLQEQPVGSLPPPTAVKWPTFRLDSGSLRDEAFDLELSDSEREAMVTSPFFYKAVGVDLRSMAEIEAARSKEKKEGEAEPGQPGAWTPPVVMARYDNGGVFALRRTIGKGTVMMMTSGCFPEWNNLAAGPSVLILDSMLRSLLSRSLPARTIAPTGSELVVPVPARDQKADFDVYRPGDEKPVLAHADPTGATTFGLNLTDVGRRGIYRIHRLPDTREAGAEADAWSMLLALNGPAEESELDRVSPAELRGRLDQAGVKWVGEKESISLGGSFARGGQLWKTLMMLALGCLFVEMAVLRESKTEGKRA